jgi:hypothetical protein
MRGDGLGVISEPDSRAALSFTWQKKHVEFFYWKTRISFCGLVFSTEQLPARPIALTRSEAKLRRFQYGKMKFGALSLFLCWTVITSSGCSKRAAPIAADHPESATPPGKSPATTSEPCLLLTSEEIESVQGQPVKDTHPSSQTARGLVVSQCFFELPTPANSITVALFEKSDKAGGAAAKEYWQTTFHGGEESTRPDDETDRPGRNEEREKKSPPEKMADIGDEAFWTANPMTNALYVLKGERFIRISVGGAGDVASKRSKATTLAQFVLKRL